ncbi:MAG: sigma-70 family RNA polymerase sigma factor [Planctomycetes bacterium]|nr:sigma-70 family RNA polymerase sigma factor [Planctomycetota bacterium]
MTQFPETRESLIVQIKDPSNRDAWGKFVDLYRPVIHRIALARGLQDADAQDLTQHVLMAVAASIGRWEKSTESTRFRHWLRRVTRNAILNAISRRPPDQATGTSSYQNIVTEIPERADHSLDDETDSLIELEYRRELYLRAAAFVRTDVDPITWQAFERTVIGGLSNAQAAQELGRSIGTIYAARSRVMKRLRTAIAEIEENHQ